MKQIQRHFPQAALAFVSLLMLGIAPASAAPARVVTFGNIPQPIKGAVNPSNTSSTPLFVTNAEDKNGIGAQCYQTADASGNAQCLLATVPAGKTLVITTVTCTATVPFGYPLAPIVLNMGGTPIGGGAPISLNHRLLLTPATSIPNTLQYYGLTTPVKMYAAGASGGSTNVYVFGNVGSSPSVATALGCAISGYMVDQ